MAYTKKIKDVANQFMQFSQHFAYISTFNKTCNGEK